MSPDEYDLAYRSILPVQVVWNKKPLNIIRTVKTDMSLVRPAGCNEVMLNLNLLP